MVTAGDGNSKQRCKEKDGAGAKYSRYSEQQVEILEKVFAECPKPTSLQRQRMLDEYSVLKNLDINQIKIWFQNRRCREKQRKETIELQAVNHKLNASNKFLVEENGTLQKKMMQLVNENEWLREKRKPAKSASPEMYSECAGTWPQLSPSTSDNDTSLVFQAEGTMEEFLSKATGDAIDWIPIPGIKLGCNSVGIAYISRNCVGLAARACSTVPLSPIKIMEILRGRASWLRDCRNLEIFDKYPARDGGTIELVYSQFYAPTTLASARDFWTVRYTSAIEDGGFVRC